MPKINCIKFLETLIKRKNGRKSVIVVGGGFGDTGKGGIERAIAEYFDAFVRLSAGFNTGRTYYLLDSNGQLVRIASHIVPTNFTDGKLSVIGDWVLVDVERLVDELNEIFKVVSQPSGKLLISDKAPVYLKHHSLVEAWGEYIKGSQSVGTTQRGISTMIAGIDLRIGPRVGHLLYPDLFRQWVRGYYKFHEPIFKEMAKLKLINLNDYEPDQEAERILKLVPDIKQYITDTDPILFQLMRDNVPTLFGMTQGIGLHNNSGTYPYCSSTQSIAQSAAYCGKLPMSEFGSIIYVDKPFLTRVGKGYFPTGLWSREDAERFPIEHPEFFKDGKERTNFLSEKLKLINSGKFELVDLAQYVQVKLREIGTSTGRGREPGFPDLHLAARGVAINGADCVALNMMDVFSFMKITLPIGIGYSIDGQPVEKLTYPTPVEKLEKVKVEYEYIEIDLTGVDISGIDNEDDLPPDIMKVVDCYEKHTKKRVGIISTDKVGGKIFRSV